MRAYAYVNDLKFDCVLFKKKRRKEIKKEKGNEGSKWKRIELKSFSFQEIFDSLLCLFARNTVESAFLEKSSQFFNFNQILTNFT